MPNLTTTIENVISYNPCAPGLRKALEGINWKHGQDKNTEISLKDVLKSNGIQDTIWFLRCFEYIEYCEICADIAEGVLPLYESKYKNDDRPRKAVQAIRSFKKGEIDRCELKDIAADAFDAAAYAAYAAAADAFDAAAREKQWKK